MRFVVEKFITNENFRPSGECKANNKYRRCTVCSRNSIYQRLKSTMALKTIQSYGHSNTSTPI